MPASSIDQLIDAPAPPGGLEEFPGFSNAVLHYEQEMDDYLTNLRLQTLAEPPEGYAPVATSLSVHAANPQIALGLFMKAHGAPVELTELNVGSADDPDSVFTVWVAPEIEEAYTTLWTEMFNKPARRLANDMTQSRIDALSAFPSEANVVRTVNGDTLWAHKQGILERAYVTSMLHQFEQYGAGPDEIRSVAEEAPLVEALITERTILPLSLETIVSMGLASASQVLDERPELIKQLHLDPSDLPNIVSNMLELGGAEGFSKAYKSYWAPVLQAMDVEKESTTE